MVELAVDAHDRLHDGLREPVGPRLLGEFLADELVVLRVDDAARPDGAREQLGRVPESRADLGDPHPRRDTDERQQLVGVATGVERAIVG